MNDPPPVSDQHIHHTHDADAASGPSGPPPPAAWRAAAARAAVNERLYDVVFLDDGRVDMNHLDMMLLVVSSRILNHVGRFSLADMAGGWNGSISTSRLLGFDDESIQVRPELEMVD